MKQENKDYLKKLLSSLIEDYEAGIKRRKEILEKGRFNYLMSISERVNVSSDISHLCTERDTLKLVLEDLDK